MIREISSEAPLRILLVLNVPWDARLGAARVFMTLADEWRAAGHAVEKFSLSDAFEGNAAGLRLAFRQILFTRKAAAFIRSKHSSFDVIDALTGAVATSKRRLNFDGLLVARSVGLFRLYDAFEKSISRRWPDLRRSKFIARLFHATAQGWLRRSSERSLRHADLINVPNEEEARVLRTSGVAAVRVVVQPYGLTNQQRGEFAETAQNAAARLAAKRVCFIGMWSARKGSRDWPLIVRELRARIPDVRFRFLGTLVESARVLRDLGLERDEKIELVSDFDAARLPELLKDCTVGAFPSYIEGFGLAVLEQLAAGIPVVAYDVAGPRDMLGPDLTNMLSQAGDVRAFAEHLAQVLLADGESYRELTQRCVDRSQQFDWTRIARRTLDNYRRRAPKSPRGAILFLQRFGLASPGGGARILRALLDNAPVRWHSVCSSPERPPKVPNETHMPTRPSWGRIEFTRAALLPHLTAPLFAPFFRRAFRRFCRENRIRAIHAIPHWGTEFVTAQETARALRIPFFLQVHDDFEFTSRANTSQANAHRVMQSAWRDADLRFVIGERLGEEYCARYGERPYEVVTDGVEKLAPAVLPREPGTLRIYFMGLFHLGYAANLRALISALEMLHARSIASVSLTLRCGLLPAELQRDAPPFVRVLPFAGEADVARDLADADLLYLPLQFDEQSAHFVRFSLSTKMITYVGSGIPILYHGPGDAAAYHLLKEHHAALLHPSLNAAQLADLLGEIARAPAIATIAADNALQLARSRFLLAQQRSRFWNRITEHLADAAPAERKHLELAEHASA